MFGYISDLYPPDASNTPPVVTTKTVSRLLMNILVYALHLSFNYANLKNIFKDCIYLFLETG